MHPLRYLLLTGSTALLRFWFGLMGLGFAIFLVCAAEGHWEYSLMFKWAPAWLWAAAFVANGMAMIHGAYTGYYDRTHFVFECVVGLAAWSGMAIMATISQGSIGGLTVAGLLNLYLFVRYPVWK